MITGKYVLASAISYSGVTVINSAFSYIAEELMLSPFLHYMYLYMWAFEALVNPLKIGG